MWLRDALCSLTRLYVNEKPEAKSNMAFLGYNLLIWRRLSCIMLHGSRGLTVTYPVHGHSLTDPAH